MSRGWIREGKREEAHPLAGKDAEALFIERVGAAEDLVEHPGEGDFVI
jgi:hypothetical protein